jgi:hypothetical protein
VNVDIEGPFSVSFVYGPVLSWDPNTLSPAVQVSVDPQLNALRLYNPTHVDCRIIIQLPLIGSITGKKVRGRVSVSAQVAFTRTTRLIVTGGWSLEAERVEVEGCEIMVHGSGSVSIGTLMAGTCSVELNGSGFVTVGGGMSNKIMASLKGSGLIDLGRAKTNQSLLSIHGSGTIDTRTEGEMGVEIAGSGIVNSYAEPRSVSKNIAGSGKVVKKY